MIYGCHNKPRPTVGMPLLVQDGYESAVDEGWGPFSRKPIYFTAPFVMTTACQYTQQHASDPLCAGCEHRHRDG